MFENMKINKVTVQVDRIRSYQTLTYKNGRKSFREQEYKDYIQMISLQLGKLKTDKGQELTKFLLYKGTSQFNTEEMSRFIDALLDYAIESGVDVREYDN